MGPGDLAERGADGEGHPVLLHDRLRHVHVGEHARRAEQPIAELAHDGERTAVVRAGVDDERLGAAMVAHEGGDGGQGDPGRFGEAGEGDVGDAGLDPPRRRDARRDPCRGGGRRAGRVDAAGAGLAGHAGRAGGRGARAGATAWRSAVRVAPSAAASARAA